MQRKTGLSKLVFLAVFSGIAFLMEYLEFPIPGLPSFLKVDFSEIPALIAGLVYGPVAGIVVEFLKNTLHFALKSGDPIGSIANFLAGSIFVTMTVLISRKVQQMKGLVVGLLTATFIMAIVMTIANWYVILPAYTAFMNMVLSESAKWTMVSGIALFNVIKGILIAVVFIPLYIKLKPFLEQRLQFR
jgi:riboflavin transporter FmnP